MLPAVEKFPLAIKMCAGALSFFARTPWDYKLAPKTHKFRRTVLILC